MKTIWVVEEGEYSDYHVVGAFSSEANANQIADLVGGDVAEWKIDPNIAELNKGLRIYSIQMQKDGTIDSCEKVDMSSYALTSISVVMWRRSQAPAYIGKNVDDVMTATVWAKDRKHAIKIVNEHRAEFVANGKWETA